MADIAQMAVHLGLDASGLSAGAQKAVATLDAIGKSATSMAAQFKAAATVLSVGGSATNTMAQIGIQTTEAIRQEIMAISELKAQLPAADAATAALAARQEYLWATLRKAEQGAFAEAAALGVLASQLSNSGNANHVLAQIGVKTTKVLQAEIAAFDRLIAAAQGDSAATMQLAARKQALVAVLNAEQTALLAAEAAKKVTVTTEQALANAGIMTSAAFQQQITTLKGLMVAAQGDALALGQLKMRMAQLQATASQMSGQVGSASFAVISLGQGFQDAGQFGMSMSQGIRAVTNNAQMAFQAFIMLRQQTDSAAGAMKAFWVAMKGPAGWLLAFGAVTALTEGLSNHMQKAKKDAKELSDKVGAMYSIAAQPDVLSLPIERVRDMAKEASDNIDRLAASIKALQSSGTFVSSGGVGAAPVMVLPQETLDKIRDLNAELAKQGEHLTEARGKIAEYDKSIEKLSETLGFASVFDFAEEMGRVQAEIRRLGGDASKLSQKEFAELYVSTRSAAGAAREFMAGFRQAKDAVTDITTPLERFAEAAGEAESAFRNLSNAWGNMPVSEMEARLESIEDTIREGIEMGLSPDSATVQELVSQWLAVVEQIEAKMRPLRDKALGSLTVGPMDVKFGGLPGGDSDDLDALETDAMRVAAAFRDRLNAEIIDTQILLNTMPLSVIDNLSGAIGESVGQILTLQGGIEDMGKNLVQAFQSIVAEVATLIIKEKLLLMIEKSKTAENAKQAALKNMSGLGGLGTAGLVLGGFGLLTTLLSGSRNYSANSGNTTLYTSFPRRNSMAVEGVVLRSGDIEFSVSERRAVNARIGR